MKIDICNAAQQSRIWGKKRTTALAHMLFTITNALIRTMGSLVPLLVKQP